MYPDTFVYPPWATFQKFVNFQEAIKSLEDVKNFFREQKCFTDADKLLLVRVIQWYQDTTGYQPLLVPTLWRLR